MAIPLLFELRTVLDWMFVKTSLTFYEWVRVEAIYAQVYKIKTKRLRAFDTNPRGQKYSNCCKLLNGGALLAVLIGVLWFPLLFFAYPTLGESNVPLNIKINLQIGIYEPIYKGEIMQSNIHQFNYTDWKKLKALMEKNYEAKDFLDQFDHSDATALQFNVNSAVSWDISPPNRQQMVEDIKNLKLRSCKFEFRVTRKGQVGRQDIQTEVVYEFKNETVRKDLIEMLKEPQEARPTVIPFLFPKIMSVNNNGKFEVATNRFLSKGKKFHFIFLFYFLTFVFKVQTHTKIYR